jgi:glutathione-independent formaldehyde dehydrogenase
VVVLNSWRKCVNAQVVSLDDAVKAYAEFDSGISAKYLIDPHGIVRTHFAKKSKL